MIQIHDLSFGYSKRNLLFKNLHLNLAKGHIYGLLGKNGAGKSTLLKNMIGLSFPLKGLVSINGLNVAHRSPQVLENLYFIPEEIYVPAVTATQFVKSTAVFYPHLTKQNFIIICRNLKCPAKPCWINFLSGSRKK